MYSLQYLWSVGGCALRHCLSSYLMLSFRIRFSKASSKILFIQNLFNGTTICSTLWLTFLQRCIHWCLSILFVFKVLDFSNCLMESHVLSSSKVSETDGNRVKTHFLFDGTFWICTRWSFFVNFFAWHRRQVQPIWASLKEQSKLYLASLKNVPYRLCLCSSTELVWVVLWVCSTECPMRRSQKTPSCTSLAASQELLIPLP